MDIQQYSITIFVSTLPFKREHGNERREAASRAHWAANVLGRGVHRTGKFVIPW